jgi:predicted nucleic acid-binding protein
VLVVDASVVAPIVADGGPVGIRYRQRVRGERLAAPDLLRIEVLSVLRRQLATGALSRQQAEAAIDDLLDLPLMVYPAIAGIRRIWALRANLTSYDASYVALAESLECVLLTVDARLARAPGPTCIIETM